jgi:hypothetical protein
MLIWFFLCLKQAEFETPFAAKFHFLPAEVEDEA